MRLGQVYYRGIGGTNGKKIPQLVFDDMFASKLEENNRDISKQIHEILLLHHGRILTVSLIMGKLKRKIDIDQIIHFLSSNNSINELNLSFWVKLDNGREYYPKTPSYIFSCQQLRHLSIKYLDFVPPPTFEGFSKLISLELWKVDLASYVTISNCPLLERLTFSSFTVTVCLSITAPSLKFLHLDANIEYISCINTPLLVDLSLTADLDNWAVKRNSDLIKLFGSLPLIENLYLASEFILGEEVVNLPIVLNCLSSLKLSGISLTKIHEYSCTLCLIRSSPNLQILKIGLCGYPTSDEEPNLEYLGMEGL